MNLIPRDKLDRALAMKQVPALIKAYLRLGGMWAKGPSWTMRSTPPMSALIMDTQRMNEKQKNIYYKGVTA